MTQNLILAALILADIWLAYKAVQRGERHFAALWISGACCFAGLLLVKYYPDNFIANHMTSVGLGAVLLSAVSIVTGRYEKPAS